MKLVFTYIKAIKLMKYLYYALYLFYVKVIHVQNDWPPIISITGLMSFLITALCFSVVNACQYDMGYKYPKGNSGFIMIGVSFILYKVLYDYYKPREAKLIKEMNRKPLWIKVVVVGLSACFAVLVVKLWMFDGMYGVYQFIKDLLS